MATCNQLSWPEAVYLCVVIISLCCAAGFITWVLLKGK